MYVSTYRFQLSGLFSEHSLIFVLDDMASIPVGYEGAPVSATRRQRPVPLVGVDHRGLNAMDHDIIPQHIVPSVTLRLIPPSDLSESWYRGKPIIVLKDAIFQPSNAFRHADELIKHLEDHDANRPMMYFGTDGGPDHNVTSIQVILSYIAGSSWNSTFISYALCALLRTSLWSIQPNGSWAQLT